MIQIVVRILVAGITLVVFRHGNSEALPVIQGTVTFTTSRSVYVAMEYLPAVTENDSIPAGMNPDGLAPARVKAVSNSSLVLDRVPSLGEAEKGSIVYVQAAIAPRRKNSEARTGNSPSGQPEKSVNPVLLDGYSSIQYYRYRQENGKWDFDQPSFYTNARVRNILGQPISFNLRFRTRLMRELSLSDGKRNNVTRNDRFYDLSLEYGDHQSGYISVGRIRTIEVGSMGGLDGVVVQRAFGRNLTGGAFAGVTSEMDTFAGDNKAIKKGAYLRWKHGKSGGLMMDMTSSYLTEDAPGLPTVHILALEQTFSHGSSFFLNQEAELNLRPRGKNRESKLLQNVRSSISFSPFERIRIRGSYYSYLVPDYGSYYRSLDPVTVLTYAFNHTFMPTVELTLPKGIHLSGETLFGNNTPGGGSLLSYAVRCNIYNLKGFSARLSQVETLNSASRGHHTLLSFSKTMKSGLSFTLEGDGAQYVSRNSDSYRNYQVRGAASHSIGRYFLSTSLTHTWGESNPADQVFIEFSSRFRK